MTKRMIDAIQSLQNIFYRDVNDIHIFLSQALPILGKTKEEYESSRSMKDKKYFVPSLKKTKFANRNDKELKQIYTNFIDHTLYEVMIIRMVSRFEVFLGEVLEKIFLEFPRKLTISVPGVTPVKGVPLEMIFDSEDVNQILKQAIEINLSNLFFSTPHSYIEYVSKVIGINISDSAFKRFFEIKASRDLLVHNSKTINEIYLKKAGALARGKRDEQIKIDSEYFDMCVSTLKRLSGIIKRDCEKAFLPKKK